MAVNKVIFGGEALVDLTSDTVSAGTLTTGATAHSANGEQITGTYVSPVSSVCEKTGAVTLSAADVGAAEAKLLWTNASPSSSFAPQTVPLALSGYTFIIVQFALVIGWGVYCCGIFRVGATSAFSISDYEVANSAGDTSRRLYPSATGIQWYNAYKADREYYNTSLVPVAVWGIKGVN